ARLRLGARLLAGAVAGRALRAGRDRDVERDAFQRVDEVDLDPGEQVVAAQPLRLVAPAARAEGAEEISEVEADLLLVERPPRLLAPLLPLLVRPRLLPLQPAPPRPCAARRGPRAPKAPKRSPRSKPPSSSSNGRPACWRPSCHCL